MDDSKYVEMLNSLYVRLGEKKGTGNRFEIPRAEIMYQGSTTVWKNFSRFAELFRRDKEFMIKFFKRELGAPLDDRGEFVVIHRRVAQNILDVKVNSFFELYVRCKECKGPDTHIVEKDSVKILVCEICGASRVIK
ncbi:MAG: hypothetical protein NZ908_01165 [Candidatus Micrarchaeota archaeon]|nr:hypothetical protein [Candidatus Micrarchaeota archaeon]MCX8154497.1 hypothetical protein [Candidatus Micrarchaeota archaeon]